MADQIHNGEEGDKILCRPKGTVGSKDEPEVRRSIFVQMIDIHL